MKNRLLAAMALCAATSSTMPLWASEWADPTMKAVDPDFSINTPGTEAGEYYIFHPYSGMFMVNGNDWSTTLSLGDTGQLITLQYDIDYILGDPKKTGYVPGHESVYGWRMIMYDAPTNSGFHEIWVSGATRAFVDHNQQGHMLWQFEKLENGNYKIKVHDEDPTFGKASADPTVMDGYVGVPQASEQTYVYPCLDINAAGYADAGYDAAGLEWQFVDKASYEVYVAKKAFQKALIAAEEVEGFVIPAQYGELYNNADASIEEIEAAAKALSDEVVEYKFSLATPDNPIDVTEKINNPAFDGGNANGWTQTTNGSAWGFCTRADANIDGRTITSYPEAWVSSGNNLTPMEMKQTISGLPNGTYRLTADIHFDKQNDTELLVEGHQLFGKGLGAESVDSQPIPADPAGAAAIFVTHTVEFNVVDGTATIGMRLTGNVIGNWMGVDNFQLFYLGGGGDGTKALLEEFIGTAETKMEDVVAENKTFSLAGETRYNNYIDYAKALLNDPEATDSILTETVKGLQFEMDTLDIDIKAYEDLYNFINGENTGWGKWDNSSYADMDMPNYEAYLTQLEGEYDERTFVPDSMATVPANADKIFRDDVLAAALAAEEEFDLTPMIVNPNFDKDSATGWKGTGSAVSWDVNEHYNGAFDIYQDIEGLPEGTYKVCCDGFYRPANNDVCQAAWGVEGDTTNDVLAVLYGNDATQKLHHCYDVVFDEAHGGAARITGIVDEAYNGKYAINDRHGCNIVFPEGGFHNEVTCYVGADGKLRIGVKTIAGANLLGGNWTPFDSFKISYIPGDVSGLVATLQSNVEAAQAMLTNEAVTTTEAKDGLDAAIVAAQGVLESGSNDADELTAQSEALIAAVEFGQKSIDKAAELAQMVEQHVNAIDNGDYDAYMDTELYWDFNDFVYDLYDLIDSDWESLAEIESNIAEINTFYSSMLQEALGMADAKADAPVDVTALIKNPGFTHIGAAGAEEGTTDGWTVTGNAGKGNVGVLNSGVIESWNSDNFDIHQTLVGLPKGYYRLTCKGFYRMTDNNNTLVAVRDGKEQLNAMLYAKVGEEYTQLPLASVMSRITKDKTDSGDYVFGGKKDTLLVDGLAEYADYKTICVINNMAGVSTAFKEADSYNNGIWFFVPEDGANVQIGIKKDVHIGNDWTIWDDFKLKYYGTEQPDNIEGVQSGKATVVASAWYTIAGVQIGAPKQRGFYIREDIMSDGTKQAVKVFVKD